MMANFRKYWTGLFAQQTHTSPKEQNGYSGVVKANRQKYESNPGLDGVYTSLEHLLKLRFAAHALALPSAKRGLRQQSGGHLSRYKGRGMEFAEVRLYQPGDDVRSIDWRVTARRQSPHTKIFHEERERPVLILCDQSSSQFFGSKETFKCVKAAEAAALLSWATLNHGDRVGGLVFSEKGHCEIKPARSHKAVTRLLKGVADFNIALVNRFTQQKPGDENGLAKTGTRPLSALENALQECRRLSKPGALVFLISDLQDFTPACAKLLHIIRQHGDVIAIQTYDPLERELPPPGDYAVSDGINELKLSTRSHSVRNKFKELVTQRQQELNDIFTGLKIPLLALSTEDETLPFIQKHLRGGGIL